MHVRRATEAEASLHRAKLTEDQRRLSSLQVHGEGLLRLLRAVHILVRQVVDEGVVGQGASLHLELRQGVGLRRGRGQGHLQVVGGEGQADQGDHLAVVALLASRAHLVAVHRVRDGHLGTRQLGTRASRSHAQSHLVDERGLGSLHAKHDGQQVGQHRLAGAHESGEVAAGLRSGGPLGGEDGHNLVVVGVEARSAEGQGHGHATDDRALGSHGYDIQHRQTEGVLDGSGVAAELVAHVVGGVVGLGNDHLGREGGLDHRHGEVAAEVGGAGGLLGNDGHGILVRQTHSGEGHLVGGAGDQQVVLGGGEVQHVNGEVAHEDEGLHVGELDAHLVIQTSGREGHREGAVGIHHDNLLVDGDAGTVDVGHGAARHEEHLLASLHRLT